MPKYFVFLIGIICLLPAIAPAQSSQNYAVTGANLNAGGASLMTSAQYSASVTIGQGGVIGVSSSASYQVLFGVQHVFAGGQCDEYICNGDFEQRFNYWDSTENAALVVGKSGQGAQVTADGANGDIFQLLPGVFAGGQTYTATAWCKAETGERCGIFLGDANTLENPTMYENLTRQWLDGNGGWQQLRIELTLSHAERLNLFLYAPTGSVVYDDAQVTLSTEPGDMNGDGQFNIFDLQRLINCIFGSGSCDYGDVNGDGSYNIFDLQQLINKIFS